MRKIILYGLLKIQIFVLFPVPGFAYSNMCVEYFQAPMITQISQLSSAQLVALKDLARLEIEAQSIPNAIARSNQFNEVSEKLEEMIKQSRVDIQLYGKIRFEVWESIKLKRRTDAKQLRLQEEALKFEPKILSEYQKKNLTEVLHLAFQHQDKGTHARTIQVILNNPFLLSKINIRVKDTGYNLLDNAIMHAQNSEIETLLKLGIDPNEQQLMNQGETSLHKAARFRDVSILELLLKYGGSVNIRDREGTTPLFVAKSFENMEFLLRHGADANTANKKKGLFPLHYIVWFEKSIADAEAKIQLLLQYGADINARNNNGETVFHLALNNSNLAIPIFDLLKKYGADIEIKDNEGRTPLIYVVENLFRAKDEEKIKMAESLLKNGANINAQKNDGKTALHHIVDSVNIGMFDVFMKNGADVNSKDHNGVSILHQASAPTNSTVFMRPADAERIIEILLQKGADKNALTHKNNSVLHMAFPYRFPLLESLLRNGGDINIKGPEGKTILHLAVEKKQVRTVEILIKSGSDVNVRDDQGKTPLQYADQSESGIKIRNLLLQSGAVE